MKFTCAHCGGFSKVEEAPEDVLLDDGQVLTCEHCKQETVVDLNKPSFRTELYALYTVARRAKLEGDKSTLPAQYKVGEIEVGVEAWRGNWSMYVKTKKETMWFRDPAPNHQMACARAAVLAGMLAEGGCR